MLAKIILSTLSSEENHQAYSHAVADGFNSQFDLFLCDTCDLFIHSLFQLLESPLFVLTLVDFSVKMFEFLLPFAKHRVSSGVLDFGDEKDSLAANDFNLSLLMCEKSFDVQSTVHTRLFVTVNSMPSSFFPSNCE